MIILRRSPPTTAKTTSTLRRVYFTACRPAGRSHAFSAGSRRPRREIESHRGGVGGRAQRTRRGETRVINIHVGCCGTCIPPTRYVKDAREGTLGAWGFAREASGKFTIRERASTKRLIVPRSPRRRVKSSPVSFLLSEKREFPTLFATGLPRRVRFTRCVYVILAGGR